MIDSILGTIFALLYIDYLIIFLGSFEEHLKHVEAAMKLLIQAGLTIQAENAKLFRRSIEFFGYEVPAIFVKYCLQTAQRKPFISQHCVASIGD